MAFARGILSEEQRARVEANRKRALERLESRRNGLRSNSTTAVPSRIEGSSGTSTISNAASSASNQIPSTNPRGVVDRVSGSLSQIRNPETTKVSSSFVGVDGEKLDVNGNPAKRPRTELTPEQKRRIEENRQKALERKKKYAENNRDATETNNTLVDNIRLNHNNKQDSEFGGSTSSRYNPPSIRKKDYIEFDFATMKDSRGGFINDDSIQKGPDSENGETLEEWQERQKKQLLVVHDLPPPMDIESAPKCFECGSIEIDPNLYKNFLQVRACRRCMKEKPEKYSLLTKTECREDYFLTEPELRDVNLLPRIEKPNPHGYSRMQLFLRFQVEEFAWKKWGGPEGLDAEWERREEGKMKRREKRYKDQLKEMRKKTRAEEYTRKLRNGQGLGERHVHDWSAPLRIPGEENLIMRRCIDCGVETEEVVI